MLGVEAAITSDVVAKYDMTGEDVVLSAFLTSVSAPTNTDIEITVQNGVTIGGVASDALLIDSVAGYNPVLIKVAGDIQGKREGDAVTVDIPLTLINNGTISTIIDSGAITGTSNVTLQVESGGSILAGGGNGGTGGTGGNGDDVTGWSSYQHTGFSPYYQWSARSGEGIAYNCTSPKFCIAGASATNSGQLFYKGGSYYYQRGVETGFSDIYYVRRGTYQSGSGGTAGTGGLGQGYNQAKTNGAAGTSGTYRSGSGGAGGDGGNWGSDGNTGNTGGIGYFYSTASANNQRSGTAGSAGTSAGTAIKLN